MSFLALKNIKIGDTIKGKKTHHGYAVHNGKKILSTQRKKIFLKVLFLNIVEIDLLRFVFLKKV